MYDYSLTRFIQSAHWKSYKNNLEKKNRIFKQIVDAVVSLHETKLYHFDIKPDNIGVNIDENGDVSVGIFDFGTAEYLEDQ